MEQIPLPDILAADRARLEGALASQPDDKKVGLLESNYSDVAGYARHLWDQVAAARQYLLDALPDPSADDEATQALTAPRGAADDAGWDDWVAAYGSLTSVLAGPHGDSGFGEHEARQEATARRGADHASDRTLEMVQSARASEVVVEASRNAWAGNDEPGHPHVPGEPDRATSADRTSARTGASPSSAPDKSEPARSASGPSTPTAAGTARSIASLPAAVAAAAMVVGYVLGRRGTRSSAAD